MGPEPMGPLYGAVVAPSSLGVALLVLSVALLYLGVPLLSLGDSKKVAGRDAQVRWVWRTLAMAHVDHEFHRYKFL